MKLDQLYFYASLVVVAVLLLLIVLMPTTKAENGEFELAPQKEVNKQCEVASKEVQDGYFIAVWKDAVTGEMLSAQCYESDNGNVSGYQI